VTRVSWIPTIWMLYVASKPLAVWFPWSGATPESSPLDRAFLIALMFVAFWILARRKFNWSIAMKDNIWLMVLIIFMLVSVIWSSIPKASFFRWIRELQAIIMAFSVLSEPLPRRAIESILRKTTYVLIPFSILLIKYFPEYGIEYSRWTGERMWIGVSQQKNGLGLLCLIASFFLIWSIVYRWHSKKVPVWKFETHTEIFLLFLAIWLMRGPSGSFFYSATSFYALCAGLLAYWGLNLTKKLRKTLTASKIMIIVAAIMLFGIIVLFTGGSNIKYFASSAGRDATLTGRTEVWASLLPVAMRRPLLGSGFGGFWTPATKDLFRISGAHSGYLDVLLGLGFVGLFLTSIFLMASCRKAYRMLSVDFDWGVLLVCFIIMAVIHNITESSIDSLTSFLTAVIMFSTVCSANMVSYRKQ
jgi:exopolysaccharide production protein ExoQ